ncbi:helix-turn-helix transcriptional regulator [Oceanobacillus manasiensis]|uniref:helix-turn-helix transcriptional regulator n=1 Tax=Oceanobacillus manasiensis TaxID=586413 RepID=UPI0005A62141|nr:helix-turn-helix transcriptional regulator [Oceanobacillus manasiensis]
MTNSTFRLIRAYLGLTQAEFAELLGVSYSTVAGIEAGNRRVSETVQARIAKDFRAGDAFYEFVERHRILEGDRT